MSNTNFTPDKPIHPGVTLRDTLEALGMSQKELAQRADLTPKTINKIVQEEAPITPETALKLERVLGISATFWNNLDKNYQEIIARIEADRQLETEYVLAKKFTCYKEIADWGYVPKTTNIKERTKNLLNFFGVDSLDIVREIKAVAFRRTINSKVSHECVAVWLRCGELQASKINLPEFDKNKIINRIDELRSLTMLSPEIFGEKIIEICKEAGIAVVYTPYISKTYLNGATRWVNGTPIIQLNLRFSYSDTFWFTFFHELGHILFHGKTDEFVEFNISQSKETEKEKEADTFAEEKLIPVDIFNNFCDRETISIQSAKEFANEQGIHHSIVFGRLAHASLIDWKKASLYRQKLVLSKSDYEPNNN